MERRTLAESGGGAMISARNLSAYRSRDMDFNPGQTITCTVTDEPATDDARQTIQRLMRRDPASARALKRGQKARGQRMRIKTRGGRPWRVRERVGKVVHAREGNSWTMTYTPDLERDLASVERFLEIKPA